LGSVGVGKNMAGITQDLTETGLNAPLQARNQELQNRVAQLEEQLRLEASRAAATESELSSLLHYISHDLRAPLRGIDGYSRALMEDYDTRLDEMGKAYLQYIFESSSRLNQLIDGLLKYSRIIRHELEISSIDLSEMAAEISQDLKTKQPQRVVEFSITPGLVVDADVEMAYILLKSLLENAFKFTSKHPTAHIEFGETEQNGQPVFFVRDDGVGFDIAYQEQLFQPFQRLHGQHEFEGIGLGLATAQRIIQRHHGRIWGEGALEKGATFYFVI
jgi:light-regulated signal transduction histidine kinase (bacteriophytochrome)